MNKQRFTKVLRDPGQLKDEFVELKELQSAYPYAQSIHVLLAILNKNRNSNEAGDALNYAALYVADRHNLRDIMENGFQNLPKSTSFRKTEKEKGDETEKKVKKSEEITTKTTSPKISTSKIEDSKKLPSADKSEVQEIVVVKPKDPDMPKVEPLPSEGDKMRSDLIKNLQTLQASKKEWGSDEKNLKDKNYSAEPKASSENLEHTSELDSEKNITSKKSPEKSKSKSTDKPKQKSKTKKGPKPTTKTKKTESPEKIKKQQELISKFIEISPSIKAKANNPPIISSEQEDLSVSSTSFSDGLISENLADIFITQGKLDKAIDIYKKLIWKFPQKKGYFAARIEELSKKKG